MYSPQAQQHAQNKLIETVFDAIFFSAEGGQKGEVTLPFPIADALMSARPDWFNTKTGRETVCNDNYSLGNGVVCMEWRGLNKWRTDFVWKFLVEYCEENYGRRPSTWGRYTWRCSPASETYWCS